MKRHASLMEWICVIMIGVVFAPASTAAGDDAKVRERGDIELKYRWATESIFKSTGEWETAFGSTEKMVEALGKFKGTLNKSADQLLNFLNTRDEAEAQLERVYVYSSLLSDEDTRDGTHQGMKSRSRSLAIKYGQVTSWVEPELTAIPFEHLDSWMRESSELAVYRQWFDNIYRQKKHILSPREEELLAMAGEVRSTPGTAYNLLSNADITFPTIKDENGTEQELSDSAFYVFMRSSDRRVRKDAYEAIVGAHAKHRNTAAALLNGAVQNHILTVKSRGYENCLAASLDGENVPTEVYNNLITTVNDNLHLLHRYQTLRKKTLKLDDGVRAYDLFAPFITGQEIEYSYEDGIDAITTALKPLGNEYVTAMKKGFNSRWVDVYPSKGKRSGAYSGGGYLTQPFILTNYHGAYTDVSTLAHEMGHSLHSYFSRQSQPYVYSDYTIFCAEVASTSNEILLQDYVLANTTDPKKKLFLLGEFLETIRGTVFRQTMFSEFEQRIHEMAEAGQPLTADALGVAYRDIMTRYYGPDYTHDDLVDEYWIRIPHFYYNFYVYKYATSYCAAANIAGRIQASEPGAREAYMSFLKGGSTKYPVDMLKIARVDMTKPEPIKDAMKLFERLLDQTEELLKELNML